MSITLPGTRQLSEEQTEIINLALNQNWLIQGSPGTGKTIVAYFRAAQIAKICKPDQYILFLVYNRPLRIYLDALLEDNPIPDSKCQVNTYHQWLYFLIRNVFHEDPIKNYQDAPYKWNWDKLQKRFSSVEKLYHHIIVDEAQDFPVSLLKILIMISDYVTFFIDPNQAIETTKTDTAEIQSVLDTDRKFELTKNFRNTKEISSLAKLFWNQKGSFSSAYKSGPKPRAVQVADSTAELNAICQLIRNNRQKSIGIIASKENKLNQTLYDKIKSLIGDEVEIDFYTTGSDESINFNKSGLKILTYGTMKGLEFDIVIIPDADKIPATPYDTETDMNRFYVAVTRACSELYIYYTNLGVAPGFNRAFMNIANEKELLDWQSAGANTQFSSSADDDEEL